MHTIFKYPVQMSEDFAVEAPEGAEWLSVQVQGAQVCMWARVDPSRPAKVYRFGVHGTGHDMPGFTAHAPYIGTFQLAEGALVFHLFGGNYY